MWSASQIEKPEVVVSNWYKCSIHSPEKIYDYCNSWNVIKITIIVIISKSGQGKT